MTRKELEELISSVVKDYLADEESYDDNAQLCILPATWEVYAADSREVDTEAPEVDCYDIMDLVEMGAEGEWAVDDGAVESVAAEYF